MCSIILSGFRYTGAVMICVIFDLDGTLLYTLEDLWLSTNYALKSLGYNERTLEEVRGFVGNGVKKLIERSLPDNTDEAAVNECLEIFRCHYSKNSNTHTRPYEGILDVLKYLKKEGVVSAVNSNKYDAAVKKLCGEYFGDYIKIALGESQSCPRKPSPEAVNRILDTVCCKKSNAVYVGDSLVDIMTAKNAGLPCISVSWGYCAQEKLVENSAGIVHTPSELLAKLEAFVKKCKDKQS